MVRIFCASLLAVVSMTMAAGQGPADLLERARALHKQAILIDGHNDFPWALREHDAARRLESLDIRSPQPSIMTDIPRDRKSVV